MSAGAARTGIRDKPALDGARRGDVASFVRELKAGGLFTVSEEDYLRDMSALIDEYRAPCLAAQWEIATAFSQLGL